MSAVFNKMASTSSAKPVQETKTPAKDLGLTRTLCESEIELIKTEFNEKLHEHFLSTKTVEESLVMSSLMSRKCVESLILKIKMKEEKSLLDESNTNIYQDKYEIVEYEDGTQRLFFKDEDAILRRILPWEEIFDIFWKTHLKYCHPKAETLKQILQHDYIVNDFAIQYLYEVCYTCSVFRQPYYRCTLDLLSMQEVDFAFKELMIYQDMHTGFMHLRPLCYDNKESDICVELLRIFMDFGPPKEVVISNDIFKTALDQIKHLTTYAPISIDIITVTPNKRKLDGLYIKIIEWLASNNFYNWSIACYEIQLHFNTEREERMKTPYDSVFKKITPIIHDLAAVEFDSSAHASSSGERVDKGVSTASPIDFEAMSLLIETDPASANSNLTDDVQEVDMTSAAIDIEFYPDSEEMVPCEEKDPLAID